MNQIFLSLPAIIEGTIKLLALPTEPDTGFSQQKTAALVILVIVIAHELRYYRLLDLQY